jgi:hypothetical protein
MLIGKRRTQSRDYVGRDAHAEGDNSVEARAVAEPVAAEADGVPFAEVVAASWRTSSCSP